MKLRNVTRAAAIAAIYCVLTLLWPLSVGSIQVRISEALCVLPLFYPPAVEGLFIGCLISGILNGSVWYDVVFGSFTTLLAAYLTKKTRSLLPPVILNAVITGSVVYFAYTEGTGAGVWLLTMLSVGIGEAIAVLILGNLLKKFLKNYIKL